MRTLTLRRVGRSLMVTIPGETVKELSLQPNQDVPYEMEGGVLRLDLKANAPPKYRLADLIAECDLTASLSPEEAAEEETWTNLPAAGREFPI